MARSVLSYMKEDIYKVNYAKFVFNIKFTGKGDIQMFKGSGIRGVIGNGLISNHCMYIKALEDCSKCDFKNLCVTNNFFNSELKKTLYFVNDNIATAYIIDCENYEEKIDAGDGLSFTVNLFGDSIALISHLIKAVEIAGEKGGLYSIKFNLLSVTNENGDIFWSNKLMNKGKLVIKTLGDYVVERKETMGDITGIQLLTPFRYKKDGRYTENVTIADILIALNRRLQIVAALNGIEICDYVKDAAISETRKQITWVDIERYSNKQNSRMKLGGIMGAFELEGDIEGYIDYLLMGEVIHIGKNNSFGLGKYRMF